MTPWPPSRARRPPAEGLQRRRQAMSTIPCLESDAALFALLAQAELVARGADRRSQAVVDAAAVVAAAGPRVGRARRRQGIPDTFGGRSTERRGSRCVRHDSP
jgi:hypothetical protein